MAPARREGEMIERNQPTCFPSYLAVAVSSREDGTMLDRTLADRHDESVVARRRKFTKAVGIDYDSCVYQLISYGQAETYDLICEVSEPNTVGVHADALYTETPGVGLFLPVADCVATVVYDPIRRTVTSAHLGRHASVAKLMRKLVSFMATKGSQPSDLIIWMAPSVTQSDYRMEYFDDAGDADWIPYIERMDDGFYLDLAGFNTNLAVVSGVKADNIHISQANTASDS
ncbi:MAG: polyphenol oxidase family protein, partial [Candidatus Saccharimonas sp.]